MPGRGEAAPALALSLVMAAATTAWWFFQWGEVPGHFAVAESMTARATLAAAQPDQVEMYRVLVPWLYMGVAWTQAIAAKLPLAVVQFLCAIVFFYGGLRLYQHERPDASRHERLLVAAVLAFYSVSAYQSVNRYGELLAPGLLALSLSTSGLRAVAAMTFLALQRMDYAALAALVGAVRLAGGGWRVRTAVDWAVGAAAVAAVILWLSTVVPSDLPAPNHAGLYHDDGRLKVLDALNPRTWVWHMAYLLPAAGLVSTLAGRWSAALLVGAGAAMVSMRLFGSWSEVRLLLPTVIFLVCARSTRGVASPS